MSTRKWGAQSYPGGSFPITCPDPYISGYLFVSFNLWDEQCSKTLNSLCLSVSLPSKIVEQIKIPDKLSGTIRSFPGAISYSRDYIEFKFLELSGVPVFNIINEWFNKGTKHDCYYWTTAPNGTTLEYYTKITNMFPLHNIDNNFSSDLKDNNKLEHTVKFSFDELEYNDDIKNCVDDIVHEYYLVSI